MNTKIGQWVTLAVSLIGTLGVPAFATSYVHAHLTFYSVLVGLAIVLHAIFPSIFSAPVASSSTTAKVIALLAVGLLCGSVCHAQTAPAPAPKAAVAAPAAPATSLFSGSSEATALSYNGSWSAATHVTESFDLLDFGKTKANSVALEGHEVIAPGPGFTAYLGGVRFTPNVAGLFSKTNLPAGSFGFYLQGAGGVATLTQTNHISFLLGGGVQYRLTSALSWSSLHVAYLRVGKQNAAEVSTGLQYFFK